MSRSVAGLSGLELVSGIDVRPVTAADTSRYRDLLDAVARERRYLRMFEAPPAEDVAARIEEGLHRGDVRLLALAGAEAIGWADFTGAPLPSTCHTAKLGLGVRREWRGRRIGTALLTAAIDAALQRGFRRLELEVFANNTRAIALYHRHGFQLEGTRRRARHVNGEFIDAHIMARLVDD